MIAAAIAVSSRGLLRRPLDMALDAVPERIDRDAVEACLAGLPGVTAVHDLHVWPLSTTTVALTAHLVRPAHGLDDGFLAEVQADLACRFGISHATLPVERGEIACRCRLEPAGHG